MHNRFSVIDVTPDLSKKQIVIETNFKVDANTVNPNTVSLYKYDISELAEYKLEELTDQVTSIYANKDAAEKEY